MNVFVAGGTGYIGNHVIDQLLKDGHRVRALVRKGSEAKLGSKDIELRYGDIFDPASLNSTLDGCDAVIYLIGLIREFPSKGISFELAHVQGVRHLYNRAKLAGIKRWIQISAQGVKPDTPDGYRRTKYRAEEFIKAQEIDYTILRPSIVFGGETDSTVNFVNTVKNIINAAPFIVPIIGNGSYKIQPVHVDDLAKVISMIINRPSTFNKTYSLCGAKSISYNDIVDRITERYKLKKKIKIHVHALLIKTLAKLLQNIESFPVTAEQIDMLLGGNTCSDFYIFDELGIMPKEFY
jgi:NADH dehydrogenase